MVATGLRGRWLTAPLLPSAATMFTLPPIQRLGEGDDSAEPGTAGPSPSPSRSSMLSKKSPKKARRRLRLKMGSRVRISDPDPDVDGTVYSWTPINNVEEQTSFPLVVKNPQERKS